MEKFFINIFATKKKFNTRVVSTETSFKWINNLDFMDEVFLHLVGNC